MSYGEIGSDISQQEENINAEPEQSANANNRPGQVKDNDHSGRASNVNEEKHRADWENKVQEFEQQQAEWKAAEAEKQEQYSREWQEKADALNKAEATGVLQNDYAAFYKIINGAQPMRASGIGADFATLPDGALEDFFIRMTTASGLVERNGGIKAYNEAKRGFAGRAVKAYEHRKQAAQA